MVLVDRIRSMSQSGPDTASSPLRAALDVSAQPPRIACQVWFADIHSVRPGHLELLDEVERGRRERYRQDADKDRFTIGAALVRLLVAAQTQTEPARVRVDRSCHRCPQPHGKPRIIDADLHVSVSHSGDRVAVGLSGAAPVGVDVEAISGRDVTGLARTVIGPTEPIGSPRDFYTYWCRKEAIVKATGDGLQVPLIDVVVSAADTPARLVSYQGAGLPCAVADLRAGAGYAAAVAVLADGELDVHIEDAAAVLDAIGH